MNIHTLQDLQEYYVSIYIATLTFLFPLFHYEQAWEWKHDNVHQKKMMVLVMMIDNDDHDDDDEDNYEKWCNNLFGNDYNSDTDNHNHGNVVIMVMMMI